MITIYTSNPTGLLSAIKKEIDDKKVNTWDYDADGDFTHNPTQWNKKAWLRPSIPEGANKLVFSLIWPANSGKEKYTSGVYHGRFIEMLSNHFPARFTTIDLTMP